MVWYGRLPVTRCARFAFTIATHSPLSCLAVDFWKQGSPFTYLVIAVWLGTTVFWLMRMNKALAMFHGLFIIPALQVTNCYYRLLLELCTVVLFKGGPSLQ